MDYNDHMEGVEHEYPSPPSNEATASVTPDAATSSAPGAMSSALSDSSDTSELSELSDILEDPFAQSPALNAIISLLSDSSDSEGELPGPNDLATSPGAAINLPTQSTAPKDTIASTSGATMASLPGSSNLSGSGGSSTAPNNIAATSGATMAPLSGSSDRKSEKLPADPIVNAEEALDRGGELLYELYIVLRARTLAHPVHNITRCDDFFVFLHESTKTDVSRKYSTAFNPIINSYRRYKWDLFLEDALTGVLVWNQSENALLDMHDFVHYIFGDITSKMTEKYVRVRKTGVRTVTRSTYDAYKKGDTQSPAYADLSETSQSHKILIVHLKDNNEKYVVDLSGRQFYQRGGTEHRVVRYKVYEETRMDPADRDVSEGHDFGKLKSVQDELVACALGGGTQISDTTSDYLIKGHDLPSSWVKGGCQLVGLDHKDEFKAELMAAVQAWEEKNMPLKQMMMELTKVKWFKQLRTFVNDIVKHLDTFMNKKIEEEGQNWAVWLDARSKFGPAVSEGLSQEALRYNKRKLESFRLGFIRNHQVEMQMEKAELDKEETLETFRKKLLLERNPF